MPPGRKKGLKQVTVMTISKNEIKLINTLSSKKGRTEQGLFVVEGEKMVAEALASGFNVRKVYRSEEIGEETMKKISMLSSPSPALAIVEMPVYDDRRTAEAISAAVSGKTLCLALDAVRDPGNLGTIMRIADWFGIDCIFASEDTADLFNPKVVQATMGAIFRKKVVYCDIPELCDSFLNGGRQVYGTFLEGDVIYDMELEKCGLIVMGNEAHGISSAVGKKVSRKLFIPSYPGDVPTAESLNVAIATAITCSEFRRR